MILGKDQFYVCVFVMHRHWKQVEINYYIIDYMHMPSSIIGKYGSTSYIGMTGRKKRRPIVGLTTLKRACNSATNTHTKYLLVVMHKTLCSVWLTFVRRENETVQNCSIVLKNSSSSSSSYYYYS